MMAKSMTLVLGTVASVAVAARGLGQAMPVDWWERSPWAIAVGGMAAAIVFLWRFTVSLIESKSRSDTERFAEVAVLRNRIDKLEKELRELRDRQFEDSRT